ncbi:MAG: hypothetical protein JST54_24245 [Deltaproteobacteria bacterium]|nr:hypothetical protein [Deltaproteobacteria bacterium]
MRLGAVLVAAVLVAACSGSSSSSSSSGSTGDTGGTGTTGTSGSTGGSGSGGSTGGGTPLGGTCYATTECAPGLYCTASAVTCPGACAAKLETDAGCQFGDVCIDSDYCDGFSNRCTVAARTRVLGQSCTSEYDCTEGLLCPITIQKCTQPKTQGTACNVPDYDCATGLYCNPIQGCTADATQGQSCAPISVDGGFLSTSPVDCASGLFCDLNNTKTCIPQLAAGGSCTVDFDQISFMCASHYCVSNACVAACVHP